MRRYLPVLFAAAWCLWVLGCEKKAPSLVLATLPVDATVVIDDFVHPGSSPHRIAFKAAGRYKLRVTRDGFKPVEMYIALQPGQSLSQSIELVPVAQQIAAGPLDTAPQDPLVAPSPLEPLPSPALAEDTFTLNVRSEPPGASVTLRDPGASETRHAGKTPLSLNLPADRICEVALSLPGYKEHRRLIAAPMHGDQVNLQVVLIRKEPHGASPPLVLPPPDPPGPIEPIPPGTGESFGFLSVSTVPGTTVYLDGKSMGQTPIERMGIRTGTHNVLMENRDLGVRRKKTVRIRPNEHLRLSEDLR